jgi:rubrerythrin
MSNFANKSFSINEVIEIAVKIEEDGQAFYSRYALISPSEKIKKAFEFMAFEEQKHFNVFKEMLKIAGGPEKEKIYEGDNELYLKSISREAVFNNGDNTQDLILKAKDAFKALDIAIELEKVSIEFYQSIKQYIKGDGRDKINIIIDEENSHIDTINKLKADLANKPA